MDQMDRDRIEFWRGEGLSFMEVADKCGLDEEAVRVHCRRSGLAVVTPAVQTACRHCGIIFTVPDSRRKFCSDSCRNRWWSAHANLRQPPDDYRHKCARCGAIFYAPPGKQRKYCGHPCYIAGRFRNGGRHGKRTV